MAAMSTATSPTRNSIYPNSVALLRRRGSHLITIATPSGIHTYTEISRLPGTLEPSERVAPTINGNTNRWPKRTNQVSHHRICLKLDNRVRFKWSILSAEFFLSGQPLHTKQPTDEPSLCSKGDGPEYIGKRTEVCSCERPH